MLVFFLAMSLIVFATLIFHAEQARSRRRISASMRMLA